MAVVALILLIVLILLCRRRDVSVRLELFESVRVVIDARAEHCACRPVQSVDTLPELEIR
ncbi:hypothetical protein JOF56_003118 [Kibdelosporangium banguiense]|uniref:Secreted protein n=1 Tax=Kibdelosporangium banguiense TaxID=1365924 RepID=A0ABS4TFT9_9PSEU|nr:hypothetical protein [Kibdelosporangium banguiense]MBP2322733.1 hypothetical protein [Kibdelosporangium banguiense]